MQDFDARTEVDEWFRLYKDDIYRYLVHFTGSIDVEDLVQETFLRAFRGLLGFRNTSSPKSWLIAIARNAALSNSRRPSRAYYPAPEEWDTIASRERGPEEWAEHQDTLRFVLSLLDKLSPTLRDVVLLRGIQELSVAETAAILGWTKVRVNVAYHRALRTLREDLHESNLERSETHHGKQNASAEHRISAAPIHPAHALSHGTPDSRPT